MSFVCVAAALWSSSSALAQGWPEIFDPLVLRTLNLQMDNGNWQTIQNDLSFEKEVPAYLWLDGENPILVSIRRKSADALAAAPGYLKVSYKIKINGYVKGQDWHGLRAVSLDNGDDQDVVSEGLAWYLHRVAAGVYGYNAGMASWVRLVINGVDTGVYVNAEQRDKRFLQNRGLWVDGLTWLYDAEDVESYTVKEGGPADSPTVQALAYRPFIRKSIKRPRLPTPDAATLAAQLPGMIDMQGLLTMGAVDNFAGNPDAIFSHSKNFYFVDFDPSLGRTRLHLPWDLDAALGGGAVKMDVFAQRTAYSDVLLDVPEFRAQYAQILRDLMNGPFSEAALHSFLDALQPVLSQALAADPNNQLAGESVESFFAGRKAWFSERLQIVKAQVR